MPKLLEKNGAEMAAALVNISGIIKRFMNDVEFSRLFKEATKTGVKNRKTDLLEIYVDLVPRLFDKDHLNDTMRLLSEIEGKSVKELLEMNGTELLEDALAAWREQIVPFFLRLGLTVGRKQSK